MCCRSVPCRPDPGRAYREYSSDMQVRVLGPIELVSSAGKSVPLSGHKMRGLIAILALEPRATVPVERLVAALWGEEPVNGPNVVQLTVSKLRRVLADAGEID